MIKEIDLKNIRIFEGSGWNFPLSPLTVFCGTNSSGKSTLLKVLLLLRQSMGIRESYESEDGKLRFVGSQVDLGDYYSFVSNNDIQRDISITLITEDTMPIAAVEQLRSLRTPSEDIATDASVEFVPYSLKSNFRFGVIPDQKTSSEPSIFTSAESIQETLSPSPKGFLKDAVYELSVDREKLLSWQVVFSGLDEDGDPRFDILIQQDYFDMSKRLQRIIVDREAVEGYVKVRVLLRGLLPLFLLAQLPQEDDESDVEDSGHWTVEAVPSTVFHISREFEEALRGIDYIGPLRSAAKRYYITQLDTSPPMDPAGEFLPYILKDIDRYEVWYVPPDLQAKPERVPLAKAFNLWMHYIRTGEKSWEEISEAEIEVQTTKILMEFKIKSVLGDELYALADSGFGYSQLLPIVVRGLLADKDNTLIVEQPELHLNPAIQVRVAEFLVAMVQAGKQVLIETHSEHIVNTIRVLTAEDKTGELASKCGIFYIDVESERLMVRELSVQQDGTVPDWPRQFFGEAASLTGRLLRAQRRFRKQSVKKE